jgi:hypothetical protein
MRITIVLAAVVAVAGSAPLALAHAQEVGPGDLVPAPFGAVHERVLGDPAASVAALDGCVVVHDVWKPQVLAAHRTAAHSAERVAAFDDDVRRPYEKLWRSYVGGNDVFSGWVRDRLQLEHEERTALPVELGISALIVETTRGMMAYTGRRACGEWYALFGPGRADMGSLGGERIVIDFLGMPGDIDAEGVRVMLAHEVNHLIFSERRDVDPHAGTVLYRMIDEGFAAYVAHYYSGAAQSPAHALSWTEQELVWALQHERILWSMLQPYFQSAHGDVFDAFFMYDQHVLPEAPGKIGYFLGYRIVEAYVKRHGAESWRELYDLDVAQILDESRVTARGWAQLTR